MYGCKSYIKMNLCNNHSVVQFVTKMSLIELVSDLIEVIFVDIFR